ncbi:MAG: asparagine synthase (glutamine-hydrolyzing) [Verrucomicrobiae bacterium]|jgi:asparagine synthase (glutamine-hydrolysing)|nr:asparagine synthase (glutamine-hydrolyzing) [Verrucomicrobiae bacterium]
MCGIAGIISEKWVTPAQIEGAQTSLQARGPDSWGSEQFSFSPEQGWRHAAIGSAALIHRRLSIRDLSTAAGQPMCNEDGSLWIIYNGEIYGWEEEAQGLRHQGHHFKSHSDTEFILHGYEEWGDAVLEHLRGMFSFSILDLRKRRLFLARDRLGEKPLFYTVENNLFAFASTVGALSKIVGTTHSWNPNAIDAFLTHRYIPAPLSIIEGFCKLPAAHSLVVSLESGIPVAAEPQEYWKPQPSPHDNPAALLKESIRLRLISDRPLGLFLSGGIDSQAIAALIAHGKMLPELPTFTASFPNSNSYDESGAAGEIAHRLGLSQTALPIKMQVEDLATIVGDLDEPFADPSAIPTWYLCQAAVKKIVVALSGDGGDELFAGYKRYHVHQRGAFFLPRYGKKRSWNTSSLSLKTARYGRLKRTLLSYQLGWEEAYALRFAAFDPISRAFLQPDISVETSYWRRPSKALSPMAWMLECDRLNYLPEYILKKSDLCGMAHGLELRSPMLDHRFFEAVLGMPLQERFTQPPKQFLQQQIGIHALVGPKRGFNPPLHAWLHQKSFAPIYDELPRALSSFTSGQLSAKSLTVFLNQARKDHRLDELTWMLIVLMFSLEKLARGNEEMVLKEI